MKKISKENTSPLKPAPVESVPASSEPDTRKIPLHDTIAQRAFSLWQNYGEPEGRSLEIWLEAERQLLGADRQVTAAGSSSVSTGALRQSSDVAAKKLDSAKATTRGDLPVGP